MSLRTSCRHLRALLWLMTFSFITFGCQSAFASFVINMGSVAGKDISGNNLRSTLTLTFDNATRTVSSTVRQGVLLTIGGLDWNDRKLNTILFNVGQTASRMRAVYVSGVAPSSVAFKSNDYKLNNELSGFDAQIKYSTSGSNGKFFSGKSTVLFLYSTTTPIRETDFNVRNAGNQKYLGAYHINLPEYCDESAKYGSYDLLGGGGVNPVPEVSTMASYGLGILVFGMVRRRFRRK